MLGRHPYDSVGGENPVSNIKKGYFPYGKDGGGIPVGKWYNVWSHLSFKIKDAMIDTFKDGTNDPSKRTPLKIWEEFLTIYKKEIAKNWHSNELVPGKAKSKKYNGYVSSFINSLIFSISILGGLLLISNTTCSKYFGLISSFAISLNLIIPFL